MDDLNLALEQARSYAKNSHAPRTRTAYANDWAHFTRWCALHQRRPLPASPETLLAYAISLAPTCQMATIDRRICGLAFAHRQAGYPDPTQDPEVRNMLRGMRRAHGTPPRTKQAFSPQHLRAMTASLASDLRSRQAHALILIGFAGAFRRSELVALRWSDLAWVDEGVVIHVRRSKTDQEGQGHLRGIPYGKHPNDCPVERLKTWKALSRGEDDQWVFRRISAHGTLGTQPMGSYMVGRLIQELAKTIGLDPRLYGGHSLRAGFITTAAKAGVSEYQIMRHTGHRDVRTLRRYIRDASLFAENVVAAIDM